VAEAFSANTPVISSEEKTKQRIDRVETVLFPILPSFTIVNIVLPGFVIP